MPQRWQAVGNIVSDLIGLRFEVQTSRFRDKRVTAQTVKHILRFSSDNLSAASISRAQIAQFNFCILRYCILSVCGNASVRNK